MSRDVHYYASGTRQAGSRDQVTPLDAIKAALLRAREDCWFSSFRFSSFIVVDQYHIGFCYVF